MNSAAKLKIATITIAFAFIYGTADAQRWKWHHQPHHTTTIVTQPVVTIHVCNRFNQKEPLAMAVVYLNSNEYLTAKKSAKMTQLTKTTSKAELDTFVLEKQIAEVIKGKRKVYVKTEIYESQINFLVCIWQQIL